MGRGGRGYSSPSPLLPTIPGVVMRPQIKMIKEIGMTNVE